MKNKALIGTLIALVILVAGSMIYDQTKRDSSKNDVVKIGILQYVTHDALDEIEKGNPVFLLDPTFRTPADFN